MEYCRREVGSPGMRIVFISNYLNHHQLPLCNAFLNMQEIEFKFIAVEPVSQERLTFGYSDLDSKYDFVLKTYLSMEEREKAIQRMRDADILISGVYLPEYLDKKDIQEKLVFLYTERMFKKIQFNLEFIMNVLRAIKNHTLNKSKNTYILCAGAYVACEFKRLGAYKGKMYKWGYFPEIPIRNKTEALKLKDSETIQLLWVGRYLDWKRPQQAIEVAKTLKKKGYRFQLKMIGNGELEEEIKRIIYAEELEAYVSVLGAMPVHDVRKYMDKADIFLFTSNREEGWGAVLNEAMGSRCAVVTNLWIGATPFLIRHEGNGLIYDGTVEDMIKKTEFLMDNREKRIEFGEQAYHMVYKYWNGEVAARNFVKLSQQLLSGKRVVRDLEGPCAYIG